MKHTYRIACLACLLALMNPGPLPADEEKDESSRSCINVSRIRSTKVVDDSSILFYMRGKSVYHNILPRQCRGLSREDRFSYRVSGNLLCQMDSIRILYNGGFGLEEGASCGLGYFHEVTEEDIEIILDREPRPIQPEPLPPAEPEEIIEETDESR